MSRISGVLRRVAAVGATIGLMVMAASAMQDGGRPDRPEGKAQGGPPGPGGPGGPPGGFGPGMFLAPRLRPSRHPEEAPTEPAWNTESKHRPRNEAADILRGGYARTILPTAWTGSPRSSI